MPSDVVERAYRYSQSASLPQAAGASSNADIATSSDKWGQPKGAAAEGREGSSPDRAPPRAPDGSRLPKWFMKPK